MKRQPVLLIIFDGFGLNPNRLHNGWALTRTPNLDAYFATHPHTALQASGGAVGLPDGQFGNSEVGHLTLGAGRILEQELVREAIYRPRTVASRAIPNKALATVAPKRQVRLGLIACTWRCK